MNENPIPSFTAPNQAEIDAAVEGLRKSTIAVLVQRGCPTDEAAKIADQVVQSSPAEVFGTVIHARCMRQGFTPEAAAREAELAKAQMTGYIAALDATKSASAAITLPGGPPTAKLPSSATPAASTSTKYDWFYFRCSHCGVTEPIFCGDGILEDCVSQCPRCNIGQRTLVPQSVHVANKTLGWLGFMILFLIIAFCLGLLGLHR